MKKHLFYLTRTINSIHIWIGTEEDSLEFMRKTNYKMHMITPKDQISQDLSYFSGPKTSGAENHGLVKMQL